MRRNDKFWRIMTIKYLDSEELEKELSIDWFCLNV